MNEFQQWDGEYDKQFYDVLLPNGDIFEACWPNAGKMLSMDGSGRMWSVDDCIQVRKSKNPYGLEP